MPSGKLRGHRFGPDGAPLVLCVHGLSANSRSFDYLGEVLGEKGRKVVALDLRGRGFSDVTRPGTYGWTNHAKDVLAAADALGAQRFDLIGHSMGAYIGMELARQAGHRLGRLVLMVYGTTQRPHRLWKHLVMPSLLVRAARPLGKGFIVTAADRDRFVAKVRSGRAIDIDANHYGVIMHPDTAKHVQQFLS